MCRPQHGLSSAGRADKTTVADSRIAAMKKPRFRGRHSLSIGVPRFELGTSCPPDKRANQAAPHPAGARIPLVAQPLVQAVDQLGHRLEPLGDRTQAELPEVVGLDAEGLGEHADDVVRRHRPVAVHEVIEIAGREVRARCELAVGDPGLVHQALDRRPEGLLAEPLSPRHRHAFLPSSETANRVSSPVVRFRTSTMPSSRLFFPTVTRIGHPIRSASANFSPGRPSRSSSRTASPASESACAAASPIASAPLITTTWTSYGASSLGHTIPRSSWNCSTAAAITRPGPMPYDPMTIAFSC